MKLLAKHGTVKTVLAGSLTGLMLLVIQPASALTFNITYDDAGSGAGFDTNAVGLERRATLEAAATYLESVIQDTGTVDLQVQTSYNVNAGPVGTGGTHFFTAPNGYSNGFGYHHASTGNDPFGPVPDAFVRFNFGHTINSGQGAPAANETDLFSVALHELTHAMGFLTLINPNTGESAISGSNPGVYSVFDSLIVRGDGSPLFDAAGTFLGTPADLISDNLFFSGAAAVAENGGQLLKLHAPGTYTPGASISHLDATIFTDAIMQTTLQAGTMRREFTGVELAMLTDLGYSVAPAAASQAPSAVPVPASLWLSIVGLLCFRRIKSVT